MDGLAATDSRVAFHSALTQVDAQLAAHGVAVRGFGEEYAGFPVYHHFTPGLYAREIRMPAGSLVTSYIHRHKHPYNVSLGACLVLTEDGWRYIAAPYFGITEAGTRRLLLVLQDTIWTTFHVTTTTDIEAVEREVFIDPYEVAV